MNKRRVESVQDAIRTGRKWPDIYQKISEYWDMVAYHKHRVPFRYEAFFAAKVFPPDQATLVRHLNTHPTGDLVVKTSDGFFRFKQSE